MRVLLLTALLLWECLFCGAQDQIKRPNEIIIKDSSGNRLPESVWMDLLIRGYTLKAVDSSNVRKGFLVVQPLGKQGTKDLEKAPKPPESKFFTTGEKLTLFNTQDVNNNKIKLKNATGKIIVLNFWFINCPPCRREIPDLNNLVDSFSTNDKVQFVAVALDDKDRLIDFLKTTSFKYHIIDNGKYLADKYGITSYPTHVIIDTDGKVYFHTTGLASNTVYWLNKTVKELLAKDAAATASN